MLLPNTVIHWTEPYLAMALSGCAGCKITSSAQ
jgi:hypothetical protein